MNYKEITQDLFQSNSNSYLAHCISADFALGAGIAKQFKYRGVQDYLKKNYNHVWQNKGYALFSPIDGFIGVYNLVTKNRYFEKPTYETLQNALLDMKMRLPNDCNLNMPCIGAGLDRLDWNKVSQIIQNTFADTDINITICRLEK